MAKTDIPTPDELRQLIRYDPDSGKLFWLPRPAAAFGDVRPRHGATWNTRYAHTEALGCPSSNGHLHGHVSVRGKKFRLLAHRVAWAIHYGEWPNEQIDHINGDPGDNRIENLRDIAQAMNCRNSRLRSDNLAGAVGVSRVTHGRRWFARMTVNGESIHLGCFDTKEQAAKARRDAQGTHGFTERHGA